MESKKYVDYNKIIQSNVHYFDSIHNNFTYDKICDCVKECYEKGQSINRRNFYDIVSYICNNYTNSIEYNSVKIIQMFNILFCHYVPSHDMLNILLKFPEWDQCYENFLKIPEFELSTSFIEMIVERRLTNSKFTYEVNEKLINFIFNNKKLDKKLIVLMCECDSGYMIKMMSGLIDKFDGELFDNFDEETINEYMYALCDNLPLNRDILYSLEGRGMKILPKHVNLICKCSAEAMEFIFQHTGLPVTEKYFRTVVKYDYNDTKIEILIKYGYVPTYDDVSFAVKYRVEIPNIERFAIVVDKKVLELCRKYNFYPKKYKFNDVSKEMLELEQLCLTRRLKVINSFVKKHNLVPDTKCMENASCYQSNPVFGCLISYGGVVNLQCVKNCANEFRNNELLLTIIDEFNKVYNMEIESYKKEIMARGDKVKELEEKLEKIEKKI